MTRPFEKSASCPLAVQLRHVPTKAVRRTVTNDHSRAHRQWLVAHWAVAVITASPVPENSGWTPIPNETARDKRISRRALGLLVELLSYPSGWDSTADSLSAKGREGREATRTAMRELETAGYVVHVRYSPGRGLWRTASFAASTPDCAASLAAQWARDHPDLRTAEAPRSHRGTDSGTSAPTSEDAHSPSSHRDTGFWASAGRASDSRASTTKTDHKTEENKQTSDAAGAASLALNADALSMESDDADASSAAAKASAREDDLSTKPKRQKPPTLDQRLDAHLAALGPDAIDEMYLDLDNDRTGILTWAVKKARKTLGLPWSDDPEDDPGGPLARKAVALTLMALSKPDGGGITPTVEHLLGDFDWPDERTPSAARPGAKERPVLPRVKYFAAAPGVEDAAAHRTLFNEVDGLTEEELRAKVAQFREYRPGIWRKCEASAREQLEGQSPDEEQLLALALKYAIQHYKGRWPMFVRPSDKPTSTAA